MDLTNSPGNSMFKLSEIKGESGRRLGPVMAQRIYKILTSMEGEEIIDLGTNWEDSLLFYDTKFYFALTQFTNKNLNLGKKFSFKQL